MENKLGSISICEMEGIEPAVEKEHNSETNVTEKGKVDFSGSEENKENLCRPEIDARIDNNLGHNPTADRKEEIATVIPTEKQSNKNPVEKDKLNTSIAKEKKGISPQFLSDNPEMEGPFPEVIPDSVSADGTKLNGQKECLVKPPREMNLLNISEKGLEVKSEEKLSDLKSRTDQITGLTIANSEETNKNTDENLLQEEEEAEPVFDGTDDFGVEANQSLSTQLLEPESETQGYAWPEKAVALTNFVKTKSTLAVSSVMRRLSGKGDEVDAPAKEDMDSGDIREGEDSPEESESQISSKIKERIGWNPLSLIGITRDIGAESKDELRDIQESLQPIVMNGRIILYTRLGCKDCKEARLFLHRKRLRYVEINIDVYPSRKLELENISGSSAVPKVVFNQVLIGGLNELKELDDSGNLDVKIENLIIEAPPLEAPLPPLSGEDDVSSSGDTDELAVTVRKMKSIIAVKDRFYKMRRFTKCFLGSESLDFLSEDQYLERNEALEFGRKLAEKLFFLYVLDENVFEDGNHFYRFLDDDPLVSGCQNIPRGIIELKPKPIVDVSSRLRFLSRAIFEAYTSPDGKHVDYRAIHGSEEFARYLRIVEELQRVDLKDMSREEKLSFFINLYNMMAIHAILVWGHPTGPLERRKLFGDFKYVIGGCTYSLSAIQNGILRGNQRPPYNLIKPFGVKDKRLKVALPYPEPLAHFALVAGQRSAPSLRCYFPGNIDKELMEAAHDFLRSGGLVIDFSAKVASLSKILKWYSVDFGKSEIEVLKHAANYIEPESSQALLELLADTQFKVVYQPFDWGLNY